MIITIGSLEFTSQKDAKEYTRNILNKNGANSTIGPTHPDFPFFIDLLNNHTSKERKIGCGVSSFIIKKNERNTGLETHIYRKDGSLESFSWNDCSTKSTKNDEQILDAALRTAVDSQIKGFRLTTEEFCANPSCRKRTSCAVDHKSPTFYQIKTDYLSMNPNAPKEFSKQVATNQHIFKDSDKEFCDRWQAYHKKYAVLQFLCEICHKEKTANDKIINKDYKAKQR